MQDYTTNRGQVISSIASLKELSRWSNVLAQPGRVMLDLRGLSPEETGRYQDRIQRYTSVCGCEQGKMLLATMVLAYVCYLFLRPQGFSGAGWTELGVGFGLACVGALLGKVSALVRARYKLRAVVAELGQRIELLNCE